ncbi:SdrD B-like domain-containing protein [Enterococcus columbae]|uniref:Gram-positive cocci surface proteins LPxTG domain-containing protein n=1 Tax=Enterococcus columbae DSM 7374 = ATCC 51263 TaxID=1121865 RepID=S1NHT7_9ENTE|nr:SdrD B-like domain-containing protein [Enterococcus columbae]EOT40568.1 hypothetical protein OMW_01430 [Enterococcus columbae DSM 7374 = ATCC 51263]EOW80344.1 hypothetical protein I568_02044 [Enterococcus columbae DSM 7374 = ATCC 51263]OJG24269.1 hypothetical protein RR47_GL000355 [Enterococcus columbae DSM 7374 = ATCC 51263]
MRKWMKKFAVTLTILLVILGNYGLPIFSLVVQADDSISFTTEIIEDAQTHEQSVRIIGIEGNVEPSDHTLVIPEQIIVGETTYDVTEIGDQAFIGKHLTNVTFLGEKLRKIGNYAFADNQLTSLTLPDSLKEIGEYAFRDNELEHLALTHVTTLGKQAFANNKLKTIQLGEVTTIGDEVFTNNQLTIVEIGNAVTSFGTGVFGFNNRFVEVKTTNALIQNEVVANNGYGHVVNPVTVTVEFLKPDGTKLTEDQTIGSDFYDYNGVIMLGKENTYKPQPMLGYMPEQSEIKYTPDSTNYVLKVRYIEAKNPEITATKILSIRTDETFDEATLRTYFKATDYVNRDITNQLTLNPTSINGAAHAVGDKVAITATVTDAEGRTTSKEFQFNVADSLLNFVLGKIDPNGPDTIDNQWVLGDFAYEDLPNGKESGVSGIISDNKWNLLNQLDSGKLELQMILPHINPYNGKPVTTVVPNAFNTSQGKYHIARIDDYADNITTVGSAAFINYRLTNFTPDMLANLKRVGTAAFVLDASATQLSHNNIEEVNYPSTEPTAYFPNSGLTFPLDFPGRSFIYQPDASSTGLTVNLPNLKVLRDEIVTYRPEHSYTSINDMNIHPSSTKNYIYNYDTMTYLRKNMITVTPNTFSKIEKIIIDENIPELGMMRMTNTQEGQIPAFKIPDILTMNRLEYIDPTAFGGTINPNRTDKRVVIQTNNTNLQSGGHYVINPTDESIAATQLTEEDFIYDANNPKRVLGLSETGLKKLQIINDSSTLTAEEKVLRLPEHIEQVAVNAFANLNYPNLRAISGPKVKIVEERGFAGLFNAKRLSLDFPQVTSIDEDAFTFVAQGEIDQFHFPNLTDLYHHNFANMRFLHAIELPKLTHMYSAKSPLAYWYYGLKGDYDEFSKADVGSFAGSSFTTVVDKITFPSLEIIEGLHFLSGRNVEVGQPYFYAKELDFPKLKRIDLTKYENAKRNIYTTSDGWMGVFNQNFISRAVPYFGSKVERLNLSKDFEGIVWTSLDGQNQRDVYNVRLISPDPTATNQTFVFSPNKNSTGEYASINENVMPFPDSNDTNNSAPQPINYPNIYVNPRKVVIKYQTQSGQELAAPTQFYLTNYETQKTIKPKAIGGYMPVSGVEKSIVGTGEVSTDAKTFTVVDENTIHTLRAPDYFGTDTPTNLLHNIAESEVIYTYNVDNAPSVSGVELKLSNEQRKVSGSLQTVDTYLIGNAMLSTVQIDTTTVNLDRATIILNYNPEYIASVKVGTYGTVESYEVNQDSGVVTIELGKITSSTSITIPIQWQYKKYETPQNYEMSISAQLRGVIQGTNEVQRLAKDEPITLKGYYDQPNMYKVSPLNLTDYEYGLATSADDGMRAFGQYERIKKPDGEFIYRIAKADKVEFGYRVRSLDRNIAMTQITDTLPTYQYVDENGTTRQATAVFIAEENPGWQLSPDGQTVSYTKTNTNETTYLTIDKVEHKEILANALPKLYLHFPHLLFGSNVKNTAQLTLVPENQGISEPNIVVTDSITIYESILPKVWPFGGEIHYLKDNARKPWSYIDEQSNGRQAFFYDVAEDRKKEMPFVLQTTALNETLTLKNVTLTDYGLDERLYYSSVEVSTDGIIRPEFLKTSVVGVNDDASLESVTVVAYGDNGSTLMDPASDPILQRLSLPMTKGSKVVFDPQIAKQIKYIQIILPSDYAVNKHLLRFNVNTKLRNPDESQFDATPLSQKNVFHNESLLAGDVFNKATGAPVSSRNQSFSTVNKPYQSAWDKISGNFLWHDVAQILVRPYSPSVELIKTQTTSDAQNLAVTPGSAIDYTLSLHSKIGNQEYYISPVNFGYQFDQFELVDLLPVGLTIRGVELTEEFAKQKNATYQIVSNYANTGKDAIIFKADKVEFGLKEVAKIKTEVDVTVPDVQTLVNEAYLTFANNAYFGGNGKISMEGTRATPDGTYAREWVKVTRPIALVKNKEVIARKYIRNVINREMNSYGPWRTDVIDTDFVENSGVLGAEFEYRLAIINDTEGIKKNISIVDVLPFYQDKGIQELNINTGIREDRGSQFHNYLDTTRPITLQKGTTTLSPVSPMSYVITYDNRQPYSYDYTNIKDIQPVLDSITWSATANTNTKAIKIDGTQALTLNPGERLEIIIPMRAPSTQDTTQSIPLGGVAYNSFIRKDDSTLRYIEANKVGNQLNLLKKVTFTKRLKEGLQGSLIPANNDDLQATFEISNTDGTVKQIAKSDESGLVSFVVPVQYDYTIREISAPADYDLLDSEISIPSSRFHKEGGGYQDVALTSAEENSLINHKSYTGSLKINKRDANGNSLNGIRFIVEGQALSPSNPMQSVPYREELFTVNGQAALSDIPEGSYTLREVIDDSTTNFNQATGLPFDFTISSDPAIRNANEIGGISDNGKDFTLNLTNDRVHLLIQKLGVSQSSDLESVATLNDNFKEKLAGYEFQLEDVDGQTIGVVATDTNGVTKVDNLTVNKVYKITEIRTAISDSSMENSENKGYAYNNRAYYFRINASGKLEEVDNFAGENPRSFIQNILNFPNLKKTVKGSIEAIKTDDQGQPLVGVVFGLYRNEQLIEQAVTKMDETNTKAIVNFSNLMPGTYILRELKAPLGYIANQSERIIVIPEIKDAFSPKDNVTVTQNEQVVYYHQKETFINHKLKVHVYKGEMILSNVTLAVAQQAKEQNPTLIIQELANQYANVYLPLTGVEFKLFEQDGASWNVIGSYTTNEAGEIDLTSYPFDSNKSYQLIESKTLTDYRLDETPIFINLPVLSRQADFNGEINAYKNNQKILGRIIVSKYEKLADGTKQVLSGAIFDLYDNQGKLLKSATTGIDGNAVFDQLANGEYVVKERPMAGYKPNTTAKQVSINETTKLVSLIYDNEPEEFISISVQKKWLGQPRFKNISDPTDIKTIPISDIWLTVYLLEPVITDDGEEVYRYIYDEYDEEYIYLYLRERYNFSGTFRYIPKLNDSNNRNYIITEYEPYRSALGDEADIYAEVGYIGGKQFPVFRPENKSLHATGMDDTTTIYDDNDLEKIVARYRPMLTSDFVIGNVTDGFKIVNAFNNVVSVGDYVFIDKNNNHLQDADEKGLAGVKVTITNADGSNPTYYNNEGTQVTEPYTTTTNEQGYYRFINLNPGEYKIHFELTPEQVNRGYVLVDKGDGTNPTIDSNANSDGWTDVFNLQPNANKTANPMGDYLDNPTIDAGVRESTPLVSLGDYVFIDTNGNHLQDSTDQPLAGVSVQVLKADGSNPEWFNGTDFVTDPYITTTDATGHYQFTNLKPDTYKVQFTLTEAQSKLYAYVSPNVGDNDALDSDAAADHVNPSVGLTEAKAVSDLTIPQDTANAPNPLGLNNPTFDAGVTLRVDQLVSLGDKVFVDMDNNNTQTEGDLPLANMKVKVVNADGTSPTYAQNGRLVTQEYTTTTDEQGYYHFDQLVPGNYKVIFELTPEQQQIYRFVTPDVGGNDALDSDAKVVNPAISYVAETSAQEVQPTTSPPDSPTAPNPLGLTNPSFDAGVRLDAEQLVSLGDYVFIDVDGSQAQTASDQPLPNVSVEVRTADGQLPTYLKNGQLVTDVYTTTTDLNGRYQFNNLLPGSYKVYFTLNEEQKSKYQFIAPNVGGDKTKDSDATVIDPLRPERAVTAADVVNNDLTIRNRADNPFHLDNPDFDAGVAVINQLVSVGDYVFIDRDGSNTQTPGDRPLPNVTVSIVKVNPDGTTTDPTYMKNGELITAPYTTKTNQEGLYSFVDLVPGDYQVIFTLSDAQKQYYHYVTPEVGGAPSLDSDAHVDGENSAIGRSKVIHLVADPFVRNGDNNPLHLDNPTIDAGVVGPDYELPGAGKMELWFWYLASMSMLLIGLALFFGNRKRQLIAIQTMPVSTMTSKGFTNIRQDETQSDKMEMENQVAETTESLRHSTDQVRPSEEIVSDMPNVDAIGETVENRLHRSEKIVDSGKNKSSAADVEVDDPPPERPPQNKHPSSGPFSST